MKGKCNVIETSLMTCRKPEIREDGSIILPSYRGSDKKMRIKYDKKLFDVMYQTHTLKDKKLLSSWDQGELYRIVFTMKNKNLSGKIKWIIELI